MDMATPGFEFGQLHGAYGHRGYPAGTRKEEEASADTIARHARSHDRMNADTKVTREEWGEKRRKDEFLPSGGGRDLDP